MAFLHSHFQWFLINFYLSMDICSIFLFQYQFPYTMLIFRYFTFQKQSDLRIWIKTYWVIAILKKNQIYKYLISYCLGYFRVNTYRNTLKIHMYTFFKIIWSVCILEANDLKILFIWNVVKMHNNIIELFCIYLKHNWIWQKCI